MTDDGGYVIGGSTLDTASNGVGFLMKVDSLGCLTDGNCETRYFTGITPLTKDDGVVRVYPNPANTKIYIDYPATAKETKLQIIDAVGKEVFSTYNYSKDTPIDVSTFPAGIYFISLENAEGRFRGKFVRE